MMEGVKMFHRILFMILSVVMLMACSSIKSTEKPAAGTDTVDGLTYFMPKKDFLVDLIVVDSKVTEINLGTTLAYPDLTQQYVLRYSTNIFGKNTLDVKVSESGLLTSSHSKTISQVNEIFKDFATSAGNIQALRVPSLKQRSSCVDGKHKFIYSSPGSYTACGMHIDIIRQGDMANINSHSKAVNQGYSGLYYRQNIPYLIVVKGDGPNVASIVFSPSESKTHFLPIAKTFFSNNDANVTFVNGVPTQYAQDTEGEAVALLKLPADIIGAYFTAVGSAFEGFKTADQKEAAALNESLKLELAKRKYDACISAIRAGDDELVRELGCQ
jgi:hypothetical protein